MFEDFRRQIDDASFSDDDQQKEQPVKYIQPERLFLGMTPVQCFIVAIMLLMMIIILGVLFLLVTSKVVPPFLS